jgi:hypothetical protein
MAEVSTLRLHLLRATYLLLAVGLGFMVWPRRATHSNTWVPAPSVRADVEGRLGEVRQGAG